MFSLCARASNYLLLFALPSDKISTHKCTIAYGRCKDKNSITNETRTRVQMQETACVIVAGLRTILVFFAISNTITILTKEGDLQDRGTTLKLYAPLTSPKGKSSVKISSPIQFWYWDAMKYKKPSKKSGCNKTTKPKGDSNPSGVIGSARRYSPTELKVFEDLGTSEHMEESYLAAFLACWLCKFVFSEDNVNLIRPGVFKVASKMAAGEYFSLAILVLANMYNGLSIVSNSTSIEDRVAVLPYHYVYDKSGPSSSTLAKLGPLMKKYSGVLFAKSFDDLQAHAFLEVVKV
ncbi:hypothetical protein D8674_020350 [Pyrus ussuriensis x Pyrus communis]|uniref:Aminotransferase-like plant mobile domain-containing protein n=1 Tax=Pyrus ussuriensis x Pyrus communis TaxID=2448454 RepID=A0A5N5HKR2_9ROSA|nr:hypothetical protein D8674_020350 [Pyrus ussuriensis x Pyrus communis]